MIDPHRIAPRIALLGAVFAALTVAGGDGGIARAQTDGVALLLRRLEQVVQSGDPAAHAALLAETADRNSAAAFAGIQFPPGLTHVAIQERDREPLLGTLPGSGYQLVVDAFEQAGDRARVATWQIDVKRSGGQAAEGEWRIVDEQAITSVEALYKLSLNSAKQFAVRNLTITADDLALALPQGSAFVADTDHGVVAMVLLGHGKMVFRPGPEAERGQVRIFCGAETLDEKFDALYLRMSPTDFEALFAPNKLAPTAVDAREFRRADDVFREELPKSYGVDLGDLSRDPWSLLPTPGDVLAEIRTRRFDTLTYTRATTEPEDISLFDRKRHHNIALYASQRKIEMRGPFLYSENDSAGFDVLDYDIDVTSTPARDWIEGRTKLTLLVRAPALNNLTLHLAAPLVVQSVVSAEYGRLFPIRARNQDLLVINLPATVLRDNYLSLTISYAGRLEPQNPDRETATLQRQRIGPDEVAPAPESSALYSSGSYWYPQPRGADYATATMRITVPDGLECVASGDLADGSPTLIGAKDSSQLHKLYVFHATQPLRYLSFVVSRFVRGPRKLIDFPPDASSASAGRDGVWYDDLDLGVDANPRQARHGREFVERAADISAFYQSLLGDVPFPSFTMALVEKDLPGGHSPGYFAVVNQVLPTSSQTWRNDPAAFADYPDFFLAHELAHQWWGQAVGWRNYHEQWLSEGFAQYFAALYAERERGSEVFAGILRQMRRGAIDEADQGPISLGYRLGHIRGDSRIFRAIVYNKSAIVLHMLRHLVGDDAFFRGVRRFYLTSRFKAVGTDDFRAAMEAETNRSLERFFDLSIRGSRLPRIRFTYRVNSGNVILHVEQLGEVFDLPLTVTLQYMDRKPADVLMAITERVVDLRVPLAGTLRTAEISKADGSLVSEIVKN